MQLSFEIKDANSHKPLNNVVCRVFTAEGKFYTYALSDNKGKLSISVDKNDVLEISHIGYNKIKEKANSYTAKKLNSIELTEQSVSLREVTIKVPPIRAKHDTIVYNVAAFAKLGDSHLEDVLKKMPGIKVAENGTVSYQGKAINKFYIEGKDLLGSSYNQATKNMPVDAVTTIEVLENHQPVKMLQGHQFTDNAGLNIKLDKGHKSRPFGEIEGGIGGTPARWSNRLFLTQIFEKNQLLIAGKMNNTGIDISDETKEHIDVTDLDAYEPTMSPILPSFISTEALPQNRYLYNKSYSVGANYLTNLSKDATLRLNVLFYNDNSTYSNDYKYTYGGTTNVNINEINDKKQRTVTVLPILKYELNNDKVFVSNELRYSYDKTTSSNTLTTNGIGLTENIKNRPSYFQNNLTASFSLGEQIIQAKSFLRYFDRKERLNDFSESTSFYDVSERYSTKSFIAKNTLSTSIPLWNNYLDISTKVYYQHNTYNYIDDLKYNKLQLRLLPSYTILFGTDRTLSIGLPIEWLRVNLNSIDIDKKSRDRFSFSPEIDFNYQLTHTWKFVLSASIGASNNLADFYSPHSLRTAYRTVYIPNNDIFINKSKRISARFKYRNLATMFFSNISVSYIDEKRECYTNYDYTDSLTTESLIKGNNHHRMLIANATAEKSFTEAGFTIKSDINFSQTYYLLSQSGVQTHNKSNIFTATINSTYQKLKWLRATIGLTGTLFWEKNNLYDSEVLKSLIANASIFLFPVKSIDIRLMYQNYTNEISKSHYITCGIFEMAANYKINKIWEVGGSVSNILNTKDYTIIQNTGINTFRSHLPLRGREFLFRVLLRI